jgi:hypothetical protein
MGEKRFFTVGQRRTKLLVGMPDGGSWVPERSAAVSIDVSGPSPCSLSSVEDQGLWDLLEGRSGMQFHCGLVARNH